MRTLFLLLFLFLFIDAQSQEIEVDLSYKYMFANNWDKAIQTYNFSRPFLTEKQPLFIHGINGSVSYIFAETFEWEQGLDKKFHEAKGFYVIIAISLILGLSLNYIGISPIDALIYTAILYGLTAPVLIAIILHISNNKKIMGEFVNSRTTNILGFAALIIMTAAAGALVYLTIK